MQRRFGCQKNSKNGCKPCFAGFATVFVVSGKLDFPDAFLIIGLSIAKSSGIDFLCFPCFRCLFRISSRYCHEFRHRFSMLSIIPMLSHHKPVYRHELWHRFSMFSVIPMPFPHKLTLSEDFFFADDPGNSSCDHLRDPECMPDTCCAKNPAQYKCKWKDCHNVTDQGNDQRLYSLSKPF